MILRSNGDLTSRKIISIPVISKANSNWELPAFLLLLQQEIFLLLLSSKLTNSIQGKRTGRIFLLSIRSLLEPFALKLLRATDPFIVKNPSSGENTVIAGYHWYSDWGRDTMISLPGLFLIPYRFEEARSALNNFARYCRKGLIPNTFPAFGGEPVYNTVDASLWFIHALSRYFAYTRKTSFSSRIFGIL